MKYYEDLSEYRDQIEPSLWRASGPPAVRPEELYIWLWSPHGQPEPTFGAPEKNIGWLDSRHEYPRGASGEEFKAVLELDPTFDHAGPNRTLGLLYKDAPGWPTSIGSRSKARQHLLKAVELSSSFPENRLCLLEAHLEWGERKTAQAQLAATELVLADARKRFTGPAWETTWTDWDHRWAAIKAKANVAPRAQESSKRKS